MTLARWINRLLNIRPAEWPRLAVLYTMALAALVGINWGETIVQASFLQRVGVGSLPWIFISSAILSIMAIFVYTAFADRVANDRLLIAIMAVSGLAIVAGIVLLSQNRQAAVAPAFTLLYLVLNVPLTDLYNVHWATYVSGFYDTRSAKRIVPVLSTSTRMAGIIAGLTMPALNRYLAPRAIIAAWLAGLLAMAALAWAMPRLLREQRTMAPAAHNVVGAPLAARPEHVRLRALTIYRNNLQEGYEYVLRSPFLRWMAISTLTLTILLTLINYQASAIFLARLKTTVEIANFTSVLNALANLVVLPIQLLLLSRLISRIGLGNVALIYPALTLGASSGLLLAPGLAAASAASLARTILRTALRNPTENLLYNSVALRMKGRARAFIGGLIVPFGGLAGGLLLLGPLARPGLLLPAATLALACGFVAASLRVRQQYSRALIAMLEQDNLSELALAASSSVAPSLQLALADPGTLEMLRRKLADSGSHELTVFLCSLLSEIGGAQAIPILAEAVRSASDSRTRAAILDVMAASELHGPGLRELYREMLADGAGRQPAHVRLAALGALEQMRGAASLSYLNVAVELLADPDSSIRIRVLPALLESSDATFRDPAARLLDQMLESADPTRRAEGINILGRLPGDESTPGLLRALADPADEVRLAAAIAIENVPAAQLEGGATGDTAALGLALIGDLLRDPVERVRQSAVHAIAGAMVARVPGSAPALVRALADESAQVREAAADALVRYGRPAIPAVIGGLNAPDARLRKMVAVVLARIDPREYGGLVIAPHVGGDLLAIYQNLAWAEGLASSLFYPSVAILLAVLREQNAALLREIFYLLTAVHGHAAIEAIETSLHSQDDRARANAAEALESLTTPQTANLVAPLFEPDLPARNLAALGGQAWGLTLLGVRETLASLAGQDEASYDAAWLRTITASALGEMRSVALNGARSGARLVPVPRSAGAFLAPQEIFRPEAAPSKMAASKVAPREMARSEIDALLTALSSDPVAEVREAAVRCLDTSDRDQEAEMLSVIEKIILLKEVPFFQGMTIEQLKGLAAVCEEQQYREGDRIFEQGDPGGTVYVVVTGRVGIEQERRKGSFARLAVIDPRSYFGEIGLFDNGPRSAAAIAIQDTLTLRLRREPLMALVRRNPELALELISVLSGRLREANDRVADLTRSRPRELHKLYDNLS